MRKPRFYLDAKGAVTSKADYDDDFEDEEFEDEELWDDEDEEGPSGEGYADAFPQAIGLAPIDTGLLNHLGLPVIRHPVVMRVGFHREEDKYHAPTAGDDGDGSGAIVGWTYEF